MSTGKKSRKSLNFDKVMVSWFTFVLVSPMNNIGTSLAKKKKVVHEPMNLFCEHSAKFEEQSLNFDKVVVSWFTFVLVSLMNNIGTSLAKRKKVVHEPMNIFCEHSEKIEEQSLDFDKVMVSWFTFVLVSLMNNIGTSLAKKKKMVHEPMNPFCEHKPKIEEQSSNFKKFLVS